MPGARIQSSTRVRNNVSNIVDLGKRYTFTLTSPATTVADQAVSIAIPSVFSQGPDRPPFYFLGVHSALLSVFGDGGATATFSAAAYYTAGGGRRVYLGAVSDNFTAVTNSKATAVLSPIVINEPYMDAPNGFVGLDITRIGYGGGTTLTVYVWVNFAFYPVYGETDIEKVIKEGIIAAAIPKWAEDELDNPSKPYQMG